MSEQTDEAKKVIARAKTGDEEALRIVRRIGILVMQADDGSVPAHIQIAVVEYMIRLQDEFQEQN